MTNLLFKKNCSTVTTLHRVVDNWLCNIDDGLITVVCYFDITKCFDSINHDILLFKCDKYGIRENELAWFPSFFLVVGKLLLFIILCLLSFQSVLVFHRARSWDLYCSYCLLMICLNMCHPVIYMQMIQ